MKDIIVIVGPTGVGKTKLSVELAKKMNAEVINADSMQVYKRLNIGTAKVTEEEKNGIPHHLFDVVEPCDMYTVYDYQKAGRKKIEELLNENKKIIVVGGTGLYIKALLYNYIFEEETQKYDFSNYTNEELLDKIKNYCLNTDIHVNNRKRLERTLTKLLNNQKETKSGNKKIYNFTVVGLTTNRENLYKIINNRVDKMVTRGLLEEVKTLYDDNIRSKAINTGIGYKELYEYFDGIISKEEAIDKIKKNSRHYAKRQYTFFNNQFDVKWFETNYNSFDKTIDEVYNYLREE